MTIIEAYEEGCRALEAQAFDENEKVADYKAFIAQDRFIGMVEKALMVTVAGGDPFVTLAAMIYTAFLQGAEAQKIVAASEREQDAVKELERLASL